MKRLGWKAVQGRQGGTDMELGQRGIVVMEGGEEDDMGVLDLVGGVEASCKGGMDAVSVEAEGGDVRFLSRWRGLEAQLGPYRLRCCRCRQETSPISV